MLSTTYQGVEYRFFDHLYAVSRCGKLLRKLEPVAATARPDGYFSAGRRRLLHRMVAHCWCERGPGTGHVHHINHDKADNRAENLEWLSPKDHFGDRHRGISRGHVMSDVGKQKLREFRNGRPTSEATKAKQREASLRLGNRPPPRIVGTKMSDEFRLKCSQNSSRLQPCEVRGVSYGSLKEAGLALGEKPHSLRKRCLSKKFPEYRIVVPSKGLRRHPTAHVVERG